jgi:hypothetical protein
VMAPRLLPAQTTQTSVGGTYTAGGQVQQLSEDSPDLRWPNSVAVYDRMRKDGKCASVLRAMTMPIRGTAWHVVDSPDVRPEVATFVRNNLGLTEDGDSRRRRRGQGISWDGFLRHALLMLPFGHMFFEPVYDLGPPGPNDTLPAGTYAHLHRLAPILPRTISGFDIDPAGELRGITQTASGVNGQWKDIPLARDLIFPVINEMEGSDWTGTSVLRAAYKHWYLKDQLERLGMMVAERNGMGVPVGEFPADGDKTQLLAAMTSFRAGELSGLAVPAGTNVQLLGVSGSLVDLMPQILYHGQEIGRSALAMFLDMGHDNGARSLGETFLDFFTMAVNTVVSDLEEIATEDVCRELVELNFGPDEAYPDIAADTIVPQSPMTMDAIGVLVTAGVIHPDEPLERFVRERFGIPPADPETRDDPPAPPPVPPTAPGAIPGMPPVAPAKLSGETLSQAEGRLARMRSAIGRRRR